MEQLELILRRPNKALYRRGDETVKLFVEGWPAANVLNEALLQARVEEAGIPVPKLHEVCKFEGKWAIVLEYIEGETLAARMAAEPERLEAWLTRFVALQTGVHEKRSPRLPAQRDKLQRKISASGLDATMRYELHVRLGAMQAHEKVCHGDFVPSNILLRKGSGEPCIIDWSHATCGNAAADAAASYIAMQKLGEQEAAQAYLRIYCEKSDTARQYIEKWLPIVAGAALATAKPEDRAFYTAFCADVV
ncbi:MAG: aminoglycoside phosphotransferase family protein [Oscillospiraceae bacterium]|jgi:tRNA A-37 threonylcarbamoyl transferase component Bud32|nr:aminoglycoside phosphotransferase family protein [Oscillospiraceae bacterium]